MKLLLIGATGQFGRRLARRLAGMELHLVLAARREGPLRELAEELGAEWRVVDRSRPLAELDQADLVVDASGPF